MDKKNSFRQVKVNSDGLTQFQLPKSYTLDAWNTEIGLGGDDSKNSLAKNKRKQSNYLKNSFTNCKDKLKARNKLLVIIICISLILNIAGLILVVQKFKVNNNLCLNSACIQTVAKSLQYLDHTINPCSNFYDFACGNFGKDVNDIKPIKNLLDEGNSFVENQLKSYFNQSQPYEDSRLVKLVKSVYAICSTSDNSTKRLEILSLEGFFFLLKGWPTITGNNWSETKFDWMECIYELRNIGVPHEHFFKIEVEGNNNNATHYYLSINSIEDNPSHDESTELETIKTLARGLGGNETIIEKDINDMMLFKIELKKRMFNKVGTVKQSTTITIKELQIKYPEINWLSFVQNVINLPELNVTENRLITLNLENLGDLLKLILRTPKRILSNYMISTVLQHIILLFPNLYNNYFKQNIKTDHFKVAVESLPLVINSWYVKKYFSKETKNQVKNILTNIKNEFQNLLENTEWLDNSTRNYAIHKIKTMTATIGYPEELLNDFILKSYYNKLKSGFRSCSDSILLTNKFKVDSNFRKLDLPLSKDWTNIGIDVTKMKTYYNLKTNNIFISAAFILYTISDQHRPDYLNYATLGYTIGHEITHGFDSKGGKYDVNGSLNNWWSPETAKTFKQKTQCMVEQYQNITMFNMTINGNLTLLENIADNNGLRMAYNAYQALIKRNNIEEKLPGLNFTNNQMFWISYAQAQCEKMTESYFREHAQYNSHAPQRCRITGALSNMKDFAKDFNCPLNAEMNPDKKCTVW